MNKNELKRLIVEFHEYKLPDSIERDIEIDMSTDKVITLVGPRRAGKTYLLYNLIKRLETSGVDRRDMIMINFEDPRIYPFTARDLLDRTDAYSELYPSSHTTYLFFDEVQEMEEWERGIEHLHRRGGYKIFITGSSSRLGSQEIATQMRGRTLSYLVLPFSFKESLEARGLKVDENTRYSSQRFNIINHLDIVMKWGLFPEVVLTENDDTKIRILREYYNTIFLKDLVERYRIRNISLLKEMMKYLVTNISNPFSISKYHRSIGARYKVSKKTVMTYLNRLEDIHFIYLVDRYSASLRKQSNSPAKDYCIDVGMRSAVGFQFSKDLGRIAENLVFISLMHRKAKDPTIEIYHWKPPGTETDFIIKRGPAVVEAIQVAWDVEDPKTRKREEKGLMSALKQFGLDRGIIITADHEGRSNYGGGVIEYIPLWQWMLSM